MTKSVRTSGLLGPFLAVLVLVYALVAPLACSLPALAAAGHTVAGQGQTEPRAPKGPKTGGLEEEARCTLRQAGAEHGHRATRSRPVPAGTAASSSPSRSEAGAGSPADAVAAGRAPRPPLIQVFRC